MYSGLHHCSFRPWMLCSWGWLLHQLLHHTTPVVTVHYWLLHQLLHFYSHTRLNCYWCGELNVPLHCSFTASHPALHFCTTEQLHCTFVPQNSYTASLYHSTVTLHFSGAAGQLQNSQTVTVWLAYAAQLQLLTLRTASKFQVGSITWGSGLVLLQVTLHTMYKCMKLYKLYNMSKL